MRRYAAQLAVATVMVAAVGLGAPSPAQAATCSSATGVSVVVDFHQLGGGVQAFCDTSGAGKSADAQLRDAGHSLTYVQRQPGFICRIDGKPANDPCVNTPPDNAYWSVWWSDGKSGEWKYSSVGASSLKVPEGGYVGLSWQGQTAQAKPGVTPVAHATASSSAPTPSATTRPPAHHSAGSHSSGSPGQATSASTAPSDPGSTSSAVAQASRGRQTSGHGKQKSRTSRPSHAGASKSRSRRSAQAAGPVDQVAPDAAAASEAGGLPGWVAPLAIVVLFAGIGTVLLARRRSSGGG